MITREQLEVLLAVEPIVRQAKKQVEDLHLSSPLSGVDLVTGGLTDAVAGWSYFLDIVGSRVNRGPGTKPPGSNAGRNQGPSGNGQVPRGASRAPPTCVVAD
jgi:hypothetical protein